MRQKIRALFALLLVLILLACPAFATGIEPATRSAAVYFDLYSVLLEDGSLYTWGDSDYGPITDITFADRELSREKTRFVNHGQWLSFTIDEDGTLWGWGGGGSWLGILRTEEEEEFLPVTDGVSMASQGFLSVLILKEDGSIWTIGRAGQGQNGTGSPVLDRQYAPLSKVADGMVFVASYGNTHYAIRRDGTLFGWGEMEHNWIQHNSVPMARPVPLMEDALYIAPNETGCQVIKSDHTLWNVRFSMVDDGVGGYVPETEKTYLMDDVVYANDYFAIQSDGSLWGWEKPLRQRTEYVPAAEWGEPVKLMEDAAFAEIGRYQTMVVTRSGELWAIPCGVDTPEGQTVEEAAKAAERLLDGVMVPNLSTALVEVNIAALAEPTEPIDERPTEPVETPKTTKVPVPTVSPGPDLPKGDENPTLLLLVISCVLCTILAVSLAVFLCRKRK